MEMEPHRQRHTVHTYEVDPFRELSLPALAGYLQEAAWVHARVLGYGIEDFIARGLTWVIVRQQLERLQPAMLGDAIEVTTWPSGRDRLALLRDYEVRNARGDVVARALSHWFIIDRATRRPVQPETVVDASVLKDVDHVVPLASDKLPTIGAWQGETRLPVRYQDIDMNMHANHTCYLAWAVEPLSVEAWRSQRVVSYDVQYVAECLYGDVILARLAEESARSRLHTLVREQDGKELARLRTVWADR
jgi:medium-chain acyl-[acyl-carrier-protein] hydrolase